jgi:MFS family permease
VAVPFVVQLRISPSACEPHRDARAPGGYREIVRDRAFRRLWALTALLVTVGYAQYSAAFPAVVTGSAGLDAHALALCFAANSVAVVVCQLPVLRLLRGRRRTSALAFVFAATGTAWTIVLAAGGAPSPTAALTALSLAMIVLAVAETALSPTAPALANDLAPDALRGRYNGVYTLAWSTGFAAGPALAGAALAANQASALLLALIAACALGAAGSLRLARRLPAALDIVDDRDAFAAVPEPAIA